MNKRKNNRHIQDRRIEKTKKSLYDALMTLILEKGFEAITIQEIIDRANIGRSTFYTYYENKEQLLLENMNLKMLLLDDGLLDLSKEGKLSFQFLFQHAAENVNLGKALLGKKGGEIVVNHLREIIYHKIFEYYKKMSSKDKLERQVLSLTAQGAAAGIVRMLTCWLDDGIPCSPVVIAEKCDSLVRGLLENSQ